MSLRLSRLPLIFAVAALNGCYADGLALIAATEGGVATAAGDAGSEGMTEGEAGEEGEEESALPLDDIPEQPTPEQAPYCIVDPTAGDAPLPCELAPAGTELNPELAWVWVGADGEDSVLTTPLVANLDDDNADGFVDPCDHPEIIVAAVALPSDKNGIWPPGHLHVLDGETGSSRRLPAPIDAAVSPALGDLDGDGVPELVAAQAAGPNSPYELSERHLIAMRADGSVLWTSDDVYSSRGGGAIAIADLDGDASPELLAPQHVSDADGQFLWAPQNPAAAYSMPVAVNLDLEGELEVLYGATAYDHLGQFLFTVPMVPRDRGSVAVANFDDDPFPELYVQHDGQHGIFEHDGSFKTLCPTGTAQVGGAGGHPVTIHDLDADGAAELVFGFEGDLYVLGVDEQGCTLRWSKKADMNEGLSSGTVFDLLADGSAETIYADRTHLRIFAEDGSVEFQLEIAARESIANPVVADVDGDGAAEIIVVSSLPDGAQLASSPTVMVIQNGDNSFAPSRRVWNQHTYHHSNVHEDGRVPVVELPHWNMSNGFRSNRAPSEQLLCIPPSLSDGL